MNGHASGAIHLYDHDRALALFAQAISGSYYHIKSLDDFQGSAAHQAGQPLHDRGVLYLPATLDRYTDPARNRALYRLMTLHQICHLEFGAHRFDIRSARERSPALAARALPEAGLPESDFETLYRCFPAPWLARQWFRLLEATRIDARMLRAYPGTRRDYRRIAALELMQRDPLEIIETLAGASEAMVRWSLGESIEALAARDGTGLVHVLLATATRVRAQDADVYTSADVLARWYMAVELAGMAPRSTPGMAGAMPDEGDVDDAAFEIDPVTFHGDPPAEWLQREERLADWREQHDAMNEGLALDAARAASDALSGALPDDAVPTTDTRPTAADVRKRELERDVLARRISIEESRIEHALGRNERHRGPSYLYDEWDCIAQRYRRGWCRVFEEPALDTDPAQVRAMLQRVAPHQADVRRRFEQMKPFAYQRVYRIVDGEELDFDQLVDYQTERKRGQLPDDRVYSRRDRLHRDVAAAFLVDLSASTDDPIEKPVPVYASDAGDPRGLNLRDPYDEQSGAPVGTPATRPEDAQPPRRIIDIQRESLVLMAQALDALGDPYAIYGFSGYGRDNVEFYVAKEFRDAFDYRTLAALAAMKPRRSTRMGPAIRHSIHKLKQSASALKVLIVISDGFPQDCDYGPDRADHGYGVEDTARALREADDLGIETFCVTVDRSGHDYLKRMCPDARYMVIEEIESLPGALSKVYERLTQR